MEEINLIDSQNENDGGSRRSTRLDKSRIRTKQKQFRNCEINEDIELEESERKENKEKKRMGKEEDGVGMMTEYILALKDLKINKKKKKKFSHNTTHVFASFTMNMVDFTSKYAPRIWWI